MIDAVALLAGLGTCVATVYLAIFAYAQVVISKKQNQQKATVELLLSNNNSSFHRHQRQKYLDMRRNGENFTELACKINEKGEFEDKNLTILNVLNSIEFICVGIKENIFDEAVYKRMSRGSFLKDWHTLKPYIMELRRINDNEKLFCEFEWLAEKWKNE